MQYVVNNRHQFLRNYEVHSIGTRQNNSLFPPSVSLTKVQNEAYSGIKIFSNLPVKLKELSNDRKSFEYFENQHLGT
jgi:hypothetical protein